MEDLLKLELEDLVDVRVSIASRFVESQLDSGSTVAAVSEAQWQKRGARRLHDAIGHLPSTVVYPNWFASEQIIVRGYAAQNNSAGIATRWDDVPIDPLEGSAQFLRNNINLGVLDRIEMIRGPGSSLYGESAFHGVFSMRGFESQSDVSRVNAEYASNGYYQAGIRHSRALGGSGVRLHVAGAYSGQPDQHIAYNYFEPPGSSERPFKYQSGTAVIKLTSDPQRDVSWRAGFYYDRNHPKGFLSGGTSGAGNSGLDDRDTADTLSTFAMAMGAVTYRINPNTSAEVLGYFWNQERTYDRHLTLVRDFHGTGGEDNWGLRATLKQTKLFGNTDWSLEAAVRHAEMGEVYRRVNEGATLVIPTDRLAFSNFARDVSSLSLDANTRLGDGAFQLRYGGRVDDYSDFGVHASPRLGLIYHPSNASAFKLLYGQAFRAPTALEVKGAALTEGNPGIKPETIDTYELSYMQQTSATLTELTLFQSYWRESIVVGSPTLPGFNGRYVNSGDSSARGVEASLTYNAAPWVLELSGSYTQSRNDTLQQDYVAFPKWIVNAGLGYHFPRYALDVFFNNRVMMDVDEGQIAASLQNPASLKDYWRADLNLTRRVGKYLTLALDVRNLFDRRNALPSIQPNPSPQGIPDQERSIKLALRYAL